MIALLEGAEGADFDPTFPWKGMLCARETVVGQSWNTGNSEVSMRLDHDLRPKAQKTEIRLRGPGS